MPEIFYDLTKPGSGMNYRWIQPPQIAYLVTTTDKLGNLNSTPVTLGTCVGADMEETECGNYYYTFALGRNDLPAIQARQGYRNLEEVPECVISYVGQNLLRQSQVACLPLPKGISEIDVAKLTELPSRHVTPTGIVEAGVNIEARVISSIPLGKYYQLYVCQALGVSVARDLVERDARGELHAGVWELDPLYELNILPAPGSEEPPRLYYTQLDKDRVTRMPDCFGPIRNWIGSFSEWLEDEVSRGSLTQEEMKDILALNDTWQRNPDPVTNKEVKQKLTEALRELVN